MENIGTFENKLSTILSEGFIDENYLAQVGRLYNGVQNGDLVGVGLNGSFKDAVKANCDPTWNEGDLLDQNTWSLANIAIYKKFCSESLEAELKRNQPIDGIEGNGPVERLISDNLAKAFNESVIAQGFFGDVDSTTDGVSAIDGILTKVVDYTGTRAGQRTTVTNQSKADMNTGTTAIDYMESLIDDAPLALKGQTDQIIVMTDAMARAISYNMKVNKGIYINEQWSAILGGMKVGEYSGIKVVVIPTLDAVIAQLGATDTFYQKPYVALYTTESNLMFGTANGATAGVADVKIKDDFVSQNTYAMVKYSLGVAVPNANLFQILY